jgi:hypothetical protein
MAYVISAEKRGDKERLSQLLPHSGKLKDGTDVVLDVYEESPETAATLHNILNDIIREGIAYP